MDINNILKERGDRYGAFDQQAYLSQQLKEQVRWHKNWAYLETDKQEAIEMILHKIARIINGDQFYIDSWQDIAGYAQLVVNILKEKETTNE